MVRTGPLFALLLMGRAVGPLSAEPPKDAPPLLPLDAAVHFALEHNPQLATARTQRGLAQANVVIARIYPFNPTLDSTLTGVTGPESAGITNRVFNEHILSMPLEVRGQRRQRMAAAAAGLTRTEWEIAGQELTTAIAVIRAYNGVLYRQAKWQIVEQNVRLSEQIVERAKKLVEFGQMRPADLIVANAELASNRALRGQARTAVAVARAELRTALGTTDDNFTVGGELVHPWANCDVDALTHLALESRPELHARLAAVAEAEAQMRLQVADRYGNPSLGVRYEYSESRANFIGPVVSLPIPVINRKQGEIVQREAELGRAHADLRQTEIQIAQAVQAAIARLAEARQWADAYPTTVLPSLRKAREDMERLFAQNEQGVDVLRILGVQGNLLRSLDAYLDAQFEVSQALADLAAAVGDLSVAVENVREAPLPAPSPVKP